MYTSLCASSFFPRASFLFFFPLHELNQRTKVNLCASSCVGERKERFVLIPTKNAYSVVK